MVGDGFVFDRGHKLTLPCAKVKGLEETEGERQKTKDKRQKTKGLHANEHQQGSLVCGLLSLVFNAGSGSDPADW